MEVATTKAIAIALLKNQEFLKLLRYSSHQGLTLLVPEKKVARKPLHPEITIKTYI